MIIIIIAYDTNNSRPVMAEAPCILPNRLSAQREFGIASLSCFVM